MEVPILAGAVALFGDDDDPRKEMMLGVLGLMLLLIGISVAGYGERIDGFREPIIAAFTLILGYWFGKKEEQVKVVEK